MPLSCTPQELSEAAAGFQSLSPQQLIAIQTYLLAVKVGGYTDPQTLLDDAKCFLSCLTVPQLKAIQARLLCQLVP